MIKTIFHSPQNTRKTRFIDIQQSNTIITNHVGRDSKENKRITRDGRQRYLKLMVQLRLRPTQHKIRLIPQLVTFTGGPACMLHIGVDSATMYEVQHRSPKTCPITNVYPPPYWTHTHAGTLFDCNRHWTD